MRVRADTSKPASVQADVLAVPIYPADRELRPDLAELDAATGGAITRTLEWGEFHPLEDETALVEVEGIGAARILFVASGRRGRGAWRARRGAAKAARRLQGRGATSLAFWLRDGEGPDAYAAAAIGASQGTFRPYAYYGRVRDTPAMMRSVEEVIVVGDEAPDERLLTEATAICDGVEWARELSNRSANDLYPEAMAELARGLADEGCTVEILGPAEMQALGMGALLGVGMGAAHEPRLIAVKLPGWQAGGDRRLAIVGKGVCFDSGGISIKPLERMEEMKHDKAGAAAVLAAVRTLARIAPEVPLMAVAPMVENMPGGAAQRPGDVVKAMNGKTIEVINTDAEGRLILADALHWAERQGATHLVDVATLTGAASVAFGDMISAFFARPREWGSEVAAAAEATGEWFWEMPLATEYRDTIDSAHADMVNSAAREASLIKSAVFLSEFVTVPWVHVDIGGSAYLIRDKAHNPKGSLGTTVSTLVRLARDFAQG